MNSESKEKFNFENLKVYHKSLEYLDFVYELTEKFPKRETFNLISQYTRAATSVALNIGEGSGGTPAEFKNFIRISFKSLNECVVCTTVALRRKYISEKENNQSRQFVIELQRMLSGLRNSLDRK